MEASVKISITDSEKWIYLGKLAHVLLILLTFIIAYNMNGNYGIGVIIAYLVAFVSAVLCLAGVIASEEKTSKIISTVLSLAATIIGAILGMILGGSVGVFIGGDTLPLGVGAVTGVNVTTSILVGVSESKYKISWLSHLISGLIQFGVLWYGLYILQYLHITLSASWY